MGDILIKESSNEGFDVIHSFQGWQIGMIRFADKLKNPDKNRFERHLFTDEAFVLLTGNAQLYIDDVSNMYEMEKEKVYVITKNVWHSITISEDGCVLVFENSGTGGCENTERHYK